MGRFIDDKTIWVIMNDNFNDVKEIIGTEMRVSPFGKIGTRTYKLGGIYMYINKALEFLKNELKVEYKKSKQKIN